MPKVVTRLLPFALSVLASTAASAQWSTTHEQFYRQSSHNWQFRRNYPAADRLFNAFDYGHAILYERLLTKPYGRIVLASLPPFARTRSEAEAIAFLAERRVQPA